MQGGNLGLILSKSGNSKDKMATTQRKKMITLIYTFLI